MGSLSIEPPSSYHLINLSARGFLFLCSLLSVLLVSSCFGKTMQFHEWEVEYMRWSPDCIESVVMGINGMFPGPEIRAHVGDTLSIKVHNKLSTEGLVIHWHGITQKNTPWADGTASISQCPINPGETFEYLFKVDKAGTYFYHGHFGMQRAAGLYGSLIVELGGHNKEPFPLAYDGEFNLLLSDWYHQPIHKQEVDLSSQLFRFIGEPQTLLINGKGQYNCSLAPSDHSSDTLCDFKKETHRQCAPEILHVKPNKTYRLRLASTTSLASLNLQISNHTMLVVEADGNYVEPFSVNDLDIYSGESYSVLLTTDQDSSKNYWISLSVRGRNATGKTHPALAVLNYTSTSSASYPESQPPIAPRWDDYDHSKSFAKKVLANTKISPRPPLISHRQITLLNRQAKINGYMKWVINSISLALPATPYLGSIKYGLTNTFDQQPPPDTYPDSYDITIPVDDPNTSVGTGVFNIVHHTIIDVVLQNGKMYNSSHGEIHPWHLHGHDFWVLGYGEGKFTKGVDEKKFNLVNPPLKNTVSVFPDGWTALRFIADNPGVWAFHCHIEPHLHMGMGVIFAEGVDYIKKSMTVPNSAISCGDTAQLLMKSNHHHHHHHHHHHRTHHRQP